MFSNWKRYYYENILMIMKDAFFGLRFNLQRTKFRYYFLGAGRRKKASLFSRTQKLVQLFLVSSVMTFNSFSVTLVSWVILATLCIRSHFDSQPCLCNITVLRNTWISSETINIFLLFLGRLVELQLWGHAWSNFIFYYLLISLFCDLKSAPLPVCYTV